VRWIDADTLGTEVFRVGQQGLGEYAILDDTLVVVEVVDEQVEGLHPLFSPASTCSHSRRSMMRGMMSKGQARSMAPSSSV
jgi:hypothetical protein